MNGEDKETEIRKQIIQNLFDDIRDFKNARRNLILLIGTIIIALWTAIGTIISQIVNSQFSENMSFCTDYFPSNCTCNNGTIQVSQTNASYSIYQFLMLHNSFHFFLFFGFLATIGLMIFWRFINRKYSLKEEEIKNKLDNLIPKSLKDDEISDSDEQFTEKLILYGLIIIWWVGSVSLVRIIPNANLPELLRTPHIFYLSSLSLYILCPLPINVLYIIFGIIGSIVLWLIWDSISIYPLKPKSEIESSWICEIISFLIPGVGQIHYGRTLRGFCILILFFTGVTMVIFDISRIIVFILILILWGGNFWEINNFKEKYNAKENSKGRS